MKKTRIIFFTAFAFFLFTFFGLTTTNAIAAPQDCAIIKKGSVSVSTAISGFTTTTSCFIAANEWEGVDETALQTEDGGANIAVLTIDRPVTLLSGTNRTTRLVAGSIAITGSGSLAVGSANTAITTSTGLWVSDEDADGWPAGFSTSTIFTATAPGIRRLGHMRSDSVADCSDIASSGSNTCYSYSQSAYWRYAYSQSGYYAYSQSAYYAYSQSAYYAYSQSAYWRYAYSQSTYWRYAYSQSAYWRYTYSQSGYYGGYGCFAAGTKVLMADGSYKEIQNIKRGDVVMSYNFDSKKKVANVVGKLLIHPTIPNGEKLLLVNGLLQITTNHNVWSPSRKQWLRIDNLQIGDTLLGQQGNEIAIHSISELPSENVPVYNLSLPGNEHNYFTEDVLVHNTWKI